MMRISLETPAVDFSHLTIHPVEGLMDVVPGVPKGRAGRSASGMQAGRPRSQSRSPRKRISGFTLIELLVTAFVVGILSIALAGAFSFGVTYQSKAEASRERELARTRFEDSVRTLLQNATMDQTDTTDTTTYFLAGADATGDDNRITFTTSIARIPGAQLASQDDFETQNQEFGPQGGLEEVSMGLTPVGQTNQTAGLFLREQRPADGDSSQGGSELVLDPDISDMQWEFFDGLNWQTTWDTAQTTRRIPAAVRVTYTLQGETNPHIFIVRLYKSDVTPDNPVTQTSTGAGA
jgi:prepilin-type N-terminal cleavage/methylation domain-containing protein